MYNSSKVRIINPPENIYVNPRWNLGVKEAKFDKVALFNDDIAIPKDFCFEVSKQMTKSMGIIRMSDAFIHETKNIKTNNKSHVYLEKINFIAYAFDLIMFFFTLLIHLFQKK